MAVDIGIGVGLTGSPREYVGLYQQRIAREDAAKRAKEKAKNEELEKFSKDIVAAQPKVHNVLIDEAKNTMAEFLNTAYGAYAKGEPNAYNTAMDSYLTAKGKFNELVNLTKQYDAFENYVANAGRSGNYVSKSQQAAFEALRNSKNRQDFTSKLSDFGVSPNDPYLNYVEDGSLAPASQKNIDFTDRTIKDLKSSVVNTNYQIGALLPDNVKSKYLTSVAQVPKTQSEADRIALEYGLQPGTLMSVESYADALFQEPGIINQYSDKFDVPPEQAKQHFVENVASKVIQPKIRQSAIPQERKINININNATDTNEVGSLSSVAGTVFGQGDLTFATDSPVGFTLSKDASLNLPLTTQTVNLKTLQPVTESNVNKIAWNQVQLQPYIVVPSSLKGKGGASYKKIVDPNDSSVDKSKIRYGKFIFGTSSSDNNDVFGDPYYRPYDDIRQGTFSGSDKNRARFNDNITQMNKVEQQLNSAIANGSLEWDKMTADQNFSGLGAVTPGEGVSPRMDTKVSKPKFKMK